MEIVDQIRQVANIIEIASQYTTLKKRGKKYVGLCPFHSEKDPSFTVDDEKQLFHCFGCGVGGDVFSLIMEKENLSFPEALKQLAEKYNIPLPRQSKLSPELLKLEETLFKINESALAFFKKNLFNTKEGQSALDYLRKRNISEKTIQELKIGYALNSWNSLLSFFQEKAISTDLLEKAGLILPGQRKGEYYDRFRGRIIFPIFSLTGKVVAFGGRTFFDAEPKYLNSPDTPLYSKGKLLYGLNFTKESVREKGELILVEGYTDFSALYQAGITNIAASLGTSLTSDQVYLALRFAPKVIINYDGDSAGKVATSRAIPLFFEKTAEPKVLILPDNHDPDSFVQKFGKEKYVDLTKRSIPLIKFLIALLSPEKGIKTLAEKVQIATEIMKITLINPNTIIGSEYLKQLCEVIGLDEEVVRSNLRVKIAEKKTEEKEFFLPAEKRLLQILIDNKRIAPYVFSEMKEGDFVQLKSELIFRTLSELFKKEKRILFHELSKIIGPSLSGHLSKTLLEKGLPATVEEALDCLYTLRKISLQNRLKELQAEIVRLEKEGEKEKIGLLLSEKQEITKKIISL